MSLAVPAIRIPAPTPIFFPPTATGLFAAPASVDQGEPAVEYAVKYDAMRLEAVLESHVTCPVRSGDWVVIRCAGTQMGVVMLLIPTHMF